jgi:hypothetical protein
VQFSKVGDRLQASRITGPTHNFLGLRVDVAMPERLLIARLQPIGKRGPSGIDEAKLVEAVMAGVARANSENGTSWHIVEITYVEDDTPVYGQYEICAHAIVQRLSRGEPFIQSASEPS